MMNTDSQSHPVITENSSALGISLWRKLFHKKLSLLSSGVLEIVEGRNNHKYGSGSGLHGTISINREAFYRKACLGGTIGISDSYKDGDWDSPDLTKLFRLFLQNQKSMDDLDKGFAKIFNKIAKFAYDLTLRNSIKGSKRNISMHYDLGNDFFESFLDATMTYSCGIFESEDSSMEEASLKKFDSIIDQLEITDRHRVLEVGCGWGGFAIRAAQRVGCKVTATTISKEQYEFATKRVCDLGLADLVDVVMVDYRNLESKFDRIVSIEMIEAVGHTFLPTYFKKLSDLLKDDGAALIQGITMPDYRYEGYLKRTDYIRSRVFPGSCCPSLSAMISASTKWTNLRPSKVTEIGHHYVITLQQWRNKFLANRDQIAQLGYSESHLRDWEFYLAYCEAGFAESYTNNVHLRLSKPNCRLN